jgi:glycosyltransferase involved in cell wall biosynthesis
MFDYARWMNPAFKVAVFSGDLHHDFTRIKQDEPGRDAIPIERNRIYFSRLGRRSIYLVSPRMLIGAVRFIHQTHQPVIVHIAEFRGLVPLYALLLKLIFRDRVLLVHSAFGMLHDKPGRRRKIYDLLFMRTFLKNVALRLAQNRHEYEAYERLCQAYTVRNRGKTVLLPLHIDGAPSQDDRFTPAGKDKRAVAQVRRQYNVPEDALVFIFLGRLHPEKGIVRMIEAYIEFSREFAGTSHSKTQMLIVGRDDGFQSQIETYIAEKQIQDRVRIITGVYETRFDYYFLADIFLGFPTICEETMLASIEALACGTPIIVSREADIPFVEEEGAGRVIDFHLTAAVEAMSEFAQNFAPLQVRARATVQRHFQGGPASKNLVQLFQQLVSRPIVAQSKS